VGKPHGSCRLTEQQLLIAEDAEKSRRGRGENLIGASGLELAPGEKLLTAKNAKKAAKGAKKSWRAWRGFRYSLPDFAFKVLIERAGFHLLQRRVSRSPAMNTKKTTEMTPFMVKKAALSFERSCVETSECS
jgi:hypothetical protein